MKWEAVGNIFPPNRHTPEVRQEEPRRACRNTAVTVSPVGARWGSTLTGTAHRSQARGHVLREGVLERNTELTGAANRKRAGEGKRRRHVSDHVPQAFSLASILAEPCVRHPEGP